MSVDAIYFCIQPELVNNWWHGPIGVTVSSLSDLVASGRDQHPKLISDEDITNVVIPDLVTLQKENPESDSLADYCQAAVDQFIEINNPSKKTGSFLKRIFPGKSKKALYEQLLVPGEFYLSFCEIAWTGPIQSTLQNVQLIDHYFPDFLTRYLDQEEAILYNGSLPQNSGPACFPDEFLPLERQVLRNLAIDLQPGYFIDPTLWQPRWEKLDTIPGLWSDLEAELGDRAAVEFLQQIKEIAAYANQHQAEILRVFW